MCIEEMCEAIDRCFFQIMENFVLLLQLLVILNHNPITVIQMWDYYASVATSNTKLAVSSCVILASNDERLKVST